MKVTFKQVRQLALTFTFRFLPELGSTLMFTSYQACFQMTFNSLHWGGGGCGGGHLLQAGGSLGLRRPHVDAVPDLCIVLKQ